MDDVFGCFRSTGLMTNELSSLRCNEFQFARKDIFCTSVAFSKGIYRKIQNFIADKYRNLLGPNKYI